MIKKHNKKGFTLIEVLVVVLILGILAAIALPSYSRSVEKSRTSEAVQVLSTIALGEQREKLAKYRYTNRAEDLDLTYTNFSDGSRATGSTFGGEFFDYTIFGDDKEAAFAQRNNGEYTLSVDYATKEIFCRPSSHFICQELGVLEGPKMSKYDMNAVETWDSLTMAQFAVEELAPLWNSSCGNDLHCLQSKLDELCATNGKCVNKLGEYGWATGTRGDGIMGSDYRLYLRDGKPMMAIGPAEIIFYSNGKVQFRGWYGSNDPEWNAIEEYLGVSTEGSGRGWRFLTPNRDYE